MIKEFLQKLYFRTSLSQEEMRQFLQLLEEGHLNEQQIAAFLAALQTKGITAEEFAAAFLFFDRSAKKFLGDEKVVQIMGTGKTKRPFNISTCAALIASVELPVAKKTSRAIASSSGSADVIEALGLDMQSSAVAKRSLQEHNLCYFFCYLLHPIFSEVVGIRRSLASPSIFDLIAAFLSAGTSSTHLIGIHNKETFKMIKEAIYLLPSFDHLLVVHSEDGIDEFSSSSLTKVLEVKKKEIKEFDFYPETLGIKKQQSACMKNSLDSSEIFLQIIQGKASSGCADLAALNAGALFYLGKKAKSIEEGFFLAKEIIESQAAYNKLLSLQAFQKAEPLL